MSDDRHEASGPYQHCRPLTEDEYATLKADIEQHGVKEYVHVDENGAILVGHHRARAAAELGIEYPRHVVTGLSEQQKHEYAVRLESLGRSKDMETKRYTALNLWRDPAVKANKTKLADLVGVTEAAVRQWIKADDDRVAAEAAAMEVIEDLRLPPAEAERVTDALGRERPTSYAPRQSKSVAEPEGEGDEESQSPEPELLPSAEPEPEPVAGDVIDEVADLLDDSGAYEEIEADRRVKAVWTFRLSWVRFVAEHPPGVFADGLGVDDLGEVVRDCDRLLEWLRQAREAAASVRRPRRVGA